MRNQQTASDRVTRLVSLFYQYEEKRLEVYATWMGVIVDCTAEEAIEKAKSLCGIYEQHFEVDHIGNDRPLLFLDNSDGDKVAVTILSASSDPLLEIIKTRSFRLNDDEPFTYFGSELDGPFKGLETELNKALNQ